MNKLKFCLSKKYFFTAPLVAEVQEFRVIYDNEERKVRVHREDSLKTFFEKFRDAFGGNFDADLITKVYQTLDQTTTYFYNLNDPTNRNLKKTIEYCSELNTNLPVYVEIGARPHDGETFL